ncbi:hypothetical protein [Halomarina ordinaria]|uniref:Uncharacterized protein n=1 Tax=Halomarina ordinaria TaxID=3033939 RepID=A0ABD5UCE2_9EURY|nr:hypothetical protein [Halomarina sp. PSRA2]
MVETVPLRLVPTTDGNTVRLVGTAGDGRWMYATRLEGVEATLRAVVDIDALPAGTDVGELKATSRNADGFRIVLSRAAAAAVVGDTPESVSGHGSTARAGPRARRRPSSGRPFERSVTTLVGYSLPATIAVAVAMLLELVQWTVRRA